MDFCKPFLHDMLYKKGSKLKISESVAYDWRCSICLSLNKIKEAQEMPKTPQDKMKEIITVDKEGLENTVFLLKPGVYPVYEYENGVKTENIKGYRFGVYGVEGPYAGVDLILRKKKSINISDLSTKVQIKVDKAETKVYANKSGIQYSLWVSDISVVKTSGE